MNLTQYFDNATFETMKAFSLNPMTPACHGGHIKQWDLLISESIWFEWRIRQPLVSTFSVLLKVDLLYVFQQSLFHTGWWQWWGVYGELDCPWRHPHSQLSGQEHLLTCYQQTSASRRFWPSGPSMSFCFSAEHVVQPPHQMLEWPWWCH